MKAGAFIDDKVDTRDVISLIPYWGGQGYLTIREVKEEKLFGLFSSPDFKFKKLNGLPGGLPLYEYTVFKRLFRDGDTVRLSDLKNEFYETMSSAQSQIERVVRKRQLHTPQSRLVWGIIPAAAAFCALLGIIFISIEQFTAGAGMFLAAIAAFIVHRPMLKKNKQGMEVYQQLYGFRLFVDKADRGRIERLLADDPAYFEKTLPFAIAFGMAGDWAAHFEGLFTEPPHWYVSSYHHSSSGNAFQSFASSFETGMRQVESSFTSSPSSSSSGGSSGGGFGGGGGGSW